QGRPAAAVAPAAVALDDRPGPADAAGGAATPVDAGPDELHLPRPAPEAPEPGGRRTDVAEVIEAPAPRPAPASEDATLRLTRPAGRSRATGRPARRAPAPESGSVSLTVEELIQASGLSARA